MAIQLSPGVNVSEVDLTTVVPGVGTSTGAFAGNFSWGPCDTSIQITSELDLVNKFYKPNSDTHISFFTAASFLAYGNDLRVVRASNTIQYNATSNASANVVISNEIVFSASYLNQSSANTLGAFVSRYPGSLGNSLAVSVIDATSNSQVFATWNYANLFSGAPNTSVQAQALGAANDELHIVVVDAGGLFTGTKGTILETYAYISKGTDSIDSLGNSNYYKNVLFNNSKYVYAVDPVDYATTSATWGTPLASKSYAVLPGFVTTTLVNGTDNKPLLGELETAYGTFADPETIDISLILTGNGGNDTDASALQNYVISMAESRMDCVAFISPPFSNVVNQAGNEVSNITTWYNALARSSSYAVSDSGWKYMFDKYNNVYRWVPLNGDIAGLCVHTDSVRDPWWSPAGFNRGNLKNVVKLAWNPNQTQRDSLYSISVNPVVALQGAGTVLYGDKTLQSKPSAFDRINVRRLFIVLEKSISRAAKYALFEFNDTFTQAQFVGLVTPFLRDVQGRRGITDFSVVCDSTNNTPEVVDSNRFIGDIYIKPARSINFIQLNFVAVRTGVAFSEIVGKF